MSYLKSKKLERQLFAYRAVKGFHGNNKEYKSVIESLGMKIYNSGLSSTLAVLKSGNTSEKVVFQQLKEWITENSVIGFSLLNNEDLLSKVLQINNSMTFSALTKEILAFTDALKEIVKAEL